MQYEERVLGLPSELQDRLRWKRYASPSRRRLADKYRSGSLTGDSRPIGHDARDLASVDMGRVIEPPGGPRSGTTLLAEGRRTVRGLRCGSRWRVSASGRADRPTSRCAVPHTTQRKRSIGS